MSKKKNKKFKKNKVEPAISPQGGAMISGLMPGDITMPGDGSGVAELQSTTVSEKTEDPRYVAVRKDVKKIILTIGSLAILLAALVVIENKTGALDSIGEWLYRISNIQGQ